MSVDQIGIVQHLEVDRSQVLSIGQHHLVAVVTLHRLDRVELVAAPCREGSLKAPTWPQGPVSATLRSVGVRNLKRSASLPVACSRPKSSWPVRRHRPLPGPIWRHADSVKLVIGLEGAVVASDAARLAVKEVHSLAGPDAHGLSVASQKAVEGALVCPPGRGLEGADGIGGMDVRDVLTGR